MTTRRAVLGGLMATAVLPTSLAACLMGDDTHASAGATTHPALRPPASHARITLLRLKAPGAVRDLVHRATGDDGTRTTLALGAGAFTGTARPRQLTTMTPFPGDLLDPQRTDADVLVQVEGDDAAAVRRASDDLVAGTPGTGVLWASDAQRPRNTVAEGRALTVNRFGFTEGLGNPDGRVTTTTDDVALVKAGNGEPQWALGGSYLALRVVRLATDLWNADPVDKQERIIGRRRDGTWLDGKAPHAVPGFDADPDGAVTPLDAHVRRANPRTGRVPAPRLVRRSWTYDAGATVGGQRDEGILFMAYQGDLEAGFLPVQRRLAGQALDRYLLTVGGGYFWVPPTTAPDAPWLDALTA